MTFQKAELSGPVCCADQLDSAVTEPAPRRPNTKHVCNWIAACIFDLLGDIARYKQWTLRSYHGLAALLHRLLLVLVRRLRHDPDQVEEVLRLVAQQRLQVAHEPVDVALAGSLVDNVLVVIIPQSAGKFLVVHLWFVFTKPPPPRHLENILR